MTPLQQRALVVAKRFVHTALVHDVLPGGALLTVETPCAGTGGRRWAATSRGSYEMAYYRPLERTDGRFDYVCTNGAGTFPIGYCHEWRESTDEQIRMIWNGDRERYEEYAKPHREAAAAGKYHGDGHATPEEACACYDRYLIDFELRFGEDRPDADERHRCKAEGCNEFTSGWASCGSYRHWHLCAKHRNPESVAAVMRVVRQ